MISTIATKVDFNLKGKVSSSQMLARLKAGLPWVVAGQDINPEMVEHQ